MAADLMKKNPDIRDQNLQTYFSRTDIQTGTAKLQLHGEVGLLKTEDDYF
jgi:hypothetical protein